MRRSLLALLAAFLLAPALLQAPAASAASEQTIRYVGGSAGTTTLGPADCPPTQGVAFVGVGHACLRRHFGGWGGFTVHVYDDLKGAIGWHFTCYRADGSVSGSGNYHGTAFPLYANTCSLVVVRPEVGATTGLVCFMSCL